MLSIKQGAVMTNNNKEGFDKFLTDETETEEGVEYIQPDIELVLSPQKRNECRQVVQEIKKFGITGQRQILYLIYLLALEIENQETMKTIITACKTGRKGLNEEKKLIIDS